MEYPNTQRIPSCKTELPQIPLWRRNPLISNTCCQLTKAIKQLMKFLECSNYCTRHPAFAHDTLPTSINSDALIRPYIIAFFLCYTVRGTLWCFVSTIFFYVINSSSHFSIQHWHIGLADSILALFSVLDNFRCWHFLVPRTLFGIGT